jgi:hypothetical protein
VNPVQHGLVNRLAITVVNADVDVLSPQAVSLERESAGSNTVARLVLAPANDGWIGLEAAQPRRQKREARFLRGNLSFVRARGGGRRRRTLPRNPSARGELRELSWWFRREAPSPMSPTARNQARLLTLKNVTGSGWFRSGGLILTRDDCASPSAQPQSKPFGVLVRSQVAAGALPFETSVGLPSVEKRCHTVRHRGSGYRQ